MSFNGFISYSHAADGRLAPAVQRGLHRLAKPWHRRRALWIFRDQTGLSVTPGLWSSIQKALDGSEWFVLLASPEAARSPWVNREIEYWIATKPADRILPVVTDGEWRWDTKLGDLSADSTAVPDALRGVFTEEPLYLDLRWARDDRHLTLRHSEFRDAIAELAAPMHGVSKDELESEDIRQHRRARRLRRVAVAAVAVLTMVASGTGVLADQNADRADSAAVEAQRQQEVAAEQRSNAERFADEARRQQENAQKQEENARAQEARAHAATTETKQQEKNAREQKAAAERATAEAERQQKNARRQQELANRSRKLAEQQQAVAREQEKLARESAKETNRQRIIAEQQQRLAEQAGAEAERQRYVARQQQLIAEEAAAEGRRQKAIAELNERKAEEAAEEARRQQQNAAEQKQLTVQRRLINQAKAAISNDPAMALRLGIAAEQIQPSAETGSELAGLVTSTRRVGTISDAIDVGYGAGDVMAVVDSDYAASLWNVADRARPVRLAALPGHLFVGEPVFSSDGKTLVIASGWDFHPTLIDVSDPAHPTLLAVVPDPTSLWHIFSPDGQTLATVDFDGIWTLWDITDRTKPTLLTRQTKGAPAPITFSPDSRTVITAGTPGTVWDITDRAHPVEVGTLDGTVRRAAYSPTRKLLTTNDSQGNMSLWHMHDRTKPQKFRTVAVRGTAAVFSRDGLKLATYDSYGTARLWDMTDNAPDHIADLDDHGGFPNTIAFSGDGRTLATAGTVGLLSMWSVTAHGEPTVISRVNGSGPGVPFGMKSALTSDGRRLTAVYSDGKATVWDLSDPAGPVARATVRIHPGDLEDAAVSPDGATVVGAGWALDKRVMVTDLSDPSKPVILSELPGEYVGGPPVFSPDGRTLAIGFDGSEMALWDLTDRRNPVRRADLPGNDVVTAVAFSPDSRTVAVAQGRIIEMWDLTDRSNPVPLGTLKGHRDTVSDMAFSPDGRTLATGSGDETAALWNVAGKFRRLAVLTGHGARVWSVAFGPDGRTLATGTEEHGAVLWDVAEHTGPVRVAALRHKTLQSDFLFFHPDGRTLLTSGKNYNDERALVWDYSALNDLRADPAAVACAVAGGGFSEDDWIAYIPEVPYQPTCTGRK